jgi:hypothetical protein
MPINISALDKLTKEAIRHFWQSKIEAVKKQKARGRSDQGKRSDVTSGKNLDGFIKLAKQIIIDNGIEEIEVYSEGKISLSIPGFFRPTKTWDLLVLSQNRLLAAIEFKSQVGPSFGNNFNNRVEEALGNATDLNTAYREGVFGESSKPFVGYVFVLEACEKSLTPVKFKSPHFETLKEFEQTSYAQRYEIFCRKLVQEGLYEAAALILTKEQTMNTGEYQCLSELTSLKRFAATLAGKVAAMAVS